LTAQLGAGYPQSPVKIPASVRRGVETVPFPMRWSDGRIRLTTARLRLLARLWHVYGREESRHAVAAYQGGDLLDVGAFHGWYSVLLAPRAGRGDRFVSFEPDPAAVPSLRAVLRDLGRTFPSLDLSVVTEPVGDGDAVGRQLPGGEAGHPRFGPAGPGSVHPSLTIDAHVAAHRLRPRLVKIDVEGVEISVLAGMARTLATHRPVVLLEVHPGWLPDGKSADDVERPLRDSGYVGEMIEATSTSSRQLWRARER
jgi:FkbM family methyltransferase